MAAAPGEPHGQGPTGASSEAPVAVDDWGALFADDIDGDVSVETEQPPSKKAKGGPDIVCLICKRSPEAVKWANYKKMRKVMVPVGQACEEDMSVKLQVWRLHVCGFAANVHDTTSQHGS